MHSPGPGNGCRKITLSDNPIIDPTILTSSLKKYRSGSSIFSPSLWLLDFFVKIPKVADLDQMEDRQHYDDF